MVLRKNTIVDVVLVKRIAAREFNSLQRTLFGIPDFDGRERKASTICASSQSGAESQSMLTAFAQRKRFMPLDPRRIPVAPRKVVAGISGRREHHFSIPLCAHPDVEGLLTHAAVQQAAHCSGVFSKRKRSLLRR